MNTTETDHYYNIVDKTCCSILLHIFCGYVIAINARSVTLPLIVVCDVVSETAVVVAECVVMRSSMCVVFVETIDGSAREQSYIQKFKHILRIDNNSFTFNGHMFY